MAFKALRKFLGLPVARAANDAGERIESLRFSVPALRVGVLEYSPGQLQTRAVELQNKTVYLYYPPEAVADPEFLKSLENSPIVLGGHNQSTNELDKKIDGWPRTVRYDEAQKAAMVEGVVKGAREAAYVRANFKTPDFGASALIDVYGLRIEEGTTPDGQKYNAVAEKLKATHLTLAPSVRDPENKIEIINAVVINSHGELKTTENQKTEIKKMERSEILALIQNTVKDVVTARNTEDEMAALKNELAETKNLVNSLMKNAAKNADEEAKKAEEAKNADKPHDEPDGDEAANADDGATLENAKPSQKVIAAFATAYNLEFGRKTPGFATLANLAGIKTEGLAAPEVITAVNTRYAEIQNAAKSETAAGKVVTGSAF